MRFPAGRLIPVGAEGPEDVVVDAQGRIYTGLMDGRVVRIEPDSGQVETIAKLEARPLGLELYGEHELVVCASDGGLLMVELATGTVRVLADQAEGVPLSACNNAAVAADGTIYFSDSCTRYLIPQWRKDLIQQTRTGRLLRRDPDGTVTQLLDGLNFANGVALAADESFVTVNETYSYGLRRVWLSGPRSGTDDVFAEDLFGFPDNASTGSDGLIWVAIASPKVAAAGVVQRLPKPVRSVVAALPPALQPKPSRTVGAIAFDASGTVVRDFRGEIDGFHMLTGVRERDGKLYFGSLVETAVWVAKL